MEYRIKPKPSKPVTKLESTATFYVKLDCEPELVAVNPGFLAVVFEGKVISVMSKDGFLETYEPNKADPKPEPPLQAQTWVTPQTPYPYPGIKSWPEKDVKPFPGMLPRIWYRTE